MPQSYLADEIRQLISRLERLSVDSTWAHRAAGVRGDLWKALAAIDSGDPSPAGLELLIQQSYRILVRAAREIPAYD